MCGNEGFEEGFAGGGEFELVPGVREPVGEFELGDGDAVPDGC